MFDNKGMLLAWPDESKLLLVDIMDRYREKSFCQINSYKPRYMFISPSNETICCPADAIGITTWLSI